MGLLDYNALVQIRDAIKANASKIMAPKVFAKRASSQEEHFIRAFTGGKPRPDFFF